MTSSLWFDGWPSLARVVLSAPLLYASVVLFVRLSGKRSTARMNNFDWIVTVAIGSLVASGVLFEDVALAEVLAGVAVLLFLQRATTRLLTRSAPFRRLVTAEPRLLVHQGRVLEDALAEERVTRAEVAAALRSAGLARFEDAEAVVLETDAELSVIPRREGADQPLPILGDVARA